MRNLSALIVDLDGKWKIHFDEDVTGKQMHLFEREAFYNIENLEDITVPSCWETLRQDYEGVAWYGRNLYVEDSWKGQSLRLHFNASNYKTEVWVNGVPVGYHEGGYTEFELEIEDFVEYGKDNFLSVRVLGPIIDQDKTIDGISRNEMPNWRGALSGGIWQSVELIVSSPVYLKNIFAEPLRDSAVNVSCTVVNHLEQDVNVTVSASIEDKRESESLIIPYGDHEFSFRIELETPVYWDLDNPYLYWAEVEAAVSELGLYDQLSERFGYRFLDYKDKKLYLNGRPMEIRAAFWEGFYPNTLAYPEDMAMVEKEIRLAKEAHMNMLRPWRRQLPTAIIDKADEMGILLVGSMAVECMKFYPMATPYTEEQVTSEFKGLILRDRNHPSIVMWECFNEIHRLILSRLKYRISMLARKLDPTRMIIDESGGFSGAHFYEPGCRVPVLFNDIHFYSGAPLEEKDYHYLTVLSKEKIVGMDTESFIAEDVMSFISEIGYGSFSECEKIASEYERNGNPITPDYRNNIRLHESLKKVIADHGLTSIFLSEDGFCRASQELHYQCNKHLLEACRLNGNFSAYMVHAYTDGDWITGAGMLDIHRNPKKAYYAYQKVFSSEYIAMRTEKTSYAPGDEVSLKLDILSDEVQDSCSLNLYMRVGACKHELLSMSIDLASGRNDLDTICFRAPEVNNIWTIVGELTLSDGRQVSNHYDILVIDHPSWKNILKVAVLGNGGLRDYLCERGVEVLEFNDALSFEIPLLIDEEQCEEVMVAVNDWVASGGSTIHMVLPELEMFSEDECIRLKPRNNVFPFDVKFCNSRGLWEPKNHVVKASEITLGLPENCLMDNLWNNVSAYNSIVEPSYDWKMGMVTYDWGMGDSTKKNYLGVHDVYSASDFLVRSYGDGSVMINCSRIASSCRYDLIAERMLFNILHKWRNIR